MHASKFLNALITFGLLSSTTFLAAQEKTNTDAKNSSTVTITRSYDAEQLIDLIATEMVLPDASAQSWISDRIASVCDRGTSNCSYSWQQEQLIVNAAESQHKKIDQLFTKLRKHGMQAFVIQSLVLRAPQDHLSELAIAWQPIPNDVPDSERAFDSKVVTASANAGSAASRVLAALHANEGKDLGTEDLFAATRQGLSPIPSELKRPQGTTGSNWSVASSAVKRSTPVLFSVLAPDQHQELIERVAVSEQIHGEFHPELVVFNGVQAAINNSIERQFVTRLESKTLMINGQPQVTFQPKLETFEEGINIKLLPEMFNETEIRLTYHLKLCNFRSVDVLELPRFDGQSNYRVQVPEVATTQFSTRVDIPIDYSLVVCAFEKNQDGKTDAVIVLSQCSIAEPTAQEPQAVSSGDEQ